MSRFSHSARIAELIEDWIHSYRLNGQLLRPSELVRELARLCYQHIDYIVLQRSLLSPFPEIPARIPIDIRDFTYSDIEAVRLMDRPSEAKLCAKRLDFGQMGLVALHNGQPIGYVWACGKIEPAIERVQLNLKPLEILCTDAFTAPAFRGKRVQPALTLALYEKAREQGYENTVAIVASWNTPSLAVLTKLGAERIAALGYYRIGVWRWTKSR